MSLAPKQPPKRGVKCDNCSQPAQGLYYQWHACDKCAVELEAVVARWNAERQAQAVV